MKGAVWLEAGRVGATSHLPFLSSSPRACTRRRQKRGHNPALQNKFS